MFQLITHNVWVSSDCTVEVTCRLRYDDARSTEVLLHQVNCRVGVVLGAWRVFLLRLQNLALSHRREHKTRLASHLLLERVHGTLCLGIFVFGLGFAALTWLHADIFLHLLLPHGRVALVVTR